MGSAQSSSKTASNDALKQKASSSSYPVYGSKDIMKKKGHGTSETPVQRNLRWGCDVREADRICNYNRHFAEPSGSFVHTKQFLQECDRAARNKTTIKFHDSNTGKLLFEAPKNRSMQEFLRESRRHGWPSFRDDEVNWDEVRCLKNGESVSLAGTHLGHNLPDRSGNRYCINLVSVAGNPK